VDNQRLGKGLGALFGEAAARQQAQVPGDGASLADSVAPSHTLLVPIDAIEPNPRQPRQQMSEAALASLAESLRSHGVIQPLIVVLKPGTASGPRYQLIAGERRLRAAELAGIQTVPVVVKDATPQQSLEMALIENLQREDLNPIEIAHAFQMLMEEYNLTHEEIAQRVGWDRSSVSNQLRLLKLPQEVQDMLASGAERFTAGHAKALIGIANPEQQVQLMKQIISQELTVREAEEAAQAYKEAALRLAQDRRGSRHEAPELHALEEEFTRAIALRVALRRTAKGGGSLTITFANEDELNMLYDLLVVRLHREEEF
jgi:ParB family chromosome partitioning protein